MSFGSQISAYNPSDAVTLVLGETSISLTPQEHGNGTKTVSQLFAEFMPRLGGDMSRVTSYTINNVTAPNHYQVRPGETVRANVKSEKLG
jgi:hypothetical protein